MIHSYNSRAMQFDTRSSMKESMRADNQQSKLRRRLLMIATVLVTLFAILSMSRGFAINQEHENHHENATLYVVQSGDTLLKIAKECLSNQDLYQVVDTIEQHNHLTDNDYIYPGEKLWVPAH